MSGNVVSVMTTARTEYEDTDQRIQTLIVSKARRRKAKANANAKP